MPAWFVALSQRTCLYLYSRGGPRSVRLSCFELVEVKTRAYCLHKDTLDDHPHEKYLNQVC